MKSGKEKKKKSSRKEKIKSIFFSNNMIIYIENPMKYTQEKDLLEEISEFIKVSGYNINIKLYYNSTY